MGIKTHTNGGLKSDSKKLTKIDLNYISLGTERIPFKLECNQIWDIEAVNFLIYFSVRLNSKKESSFYVNVHTISLCIVFSKSSLNQKFTILPLRSVCRTQDKFYHPKFWGFRLLLAIIHCQTEQKIVLLSRGQKLKSIFFYIDMYTYIMLRIFLA